MLTTAKPRRPRKAETVLRDLAHALLIVERSSGMSFPFSRSLIRELRAAIKKERVTK